jgi:hypothetical protein
MAERRTYPKTPPTPEEELMTGGTVVATNLSPQLGSDTTTLQEGEFDMQRLGIIDEKQHMALAYFIWRGGGQKFVDNVGNVRTRKGIKFWRHITKLILNLSPAVKGIGRKQLIEMQRATTPGAPPQAEPERPGWFGRNLTDRGWSGKE